LRNKLKEDLGKVEQETYITKIIHKTYVDELKRIRTKIQDEANRRIKAIEKRDAD